MNELSGAFSVPDAKSIEMVYDLLDTEGLYLGASTALNVVAAVELAVKLGKGAFSFFKWKVLLTRDFDRFKSCNYIVRRGLSVSKPAVFETVAQG